MTSPARPPSLLVVDDEPDLRTLYELTLLREGYAVHVAANLAEAREQLREHQFAAVITDMRLPDGLGLELVREIATSGRGERCMVITAYGSAENAVEALKSGAFDYLTKPVDLKHFRATVKAAVGESGKGASGQAPMVTESPCAGLLSPSAEQAMGRMVGASAVMQALKDKIVKVAKTMAPVHLRGESGTGKELAAQALHACSHRSGAPFVAVNCSAIPENLLEAEFFGVKKGSYTGATHDRDGFFQAAHRGTLFLDEIGDLPLAMQSKLLRAIQERQIRPIGSPQEEQVDVRVVSATHKDLTDEVQQGRFRQDLYYRLNVIELTLPALRQRTEDLPTLCEALVHRLVGPGGPALRMSPHALQCLAQMPLYGNVRELENLLHRAIALHEGQSAELDLDPTDLGPDCEPAVHGRTGAADRRAQRLPTDLQAHLDAQERDILVRALRDVNFNRTAAAQRLGISLRQIRYRIERLHIPMPQEDDTGHGRL